MLQLPLASIHRAATSSFVEEWGYELPAHQGDPAGEQSFLSHSVGVLDQSYRGAIDLVGKGVVDAVDHLFSSSVKELTEETGQPSCLLSPKGRLLAAFHLFLLQEDRLRLIFREPTTPEVVKALERYLLLADVAVVPLAAELAALSVLGPAAGDVARAVLDAELPRLPYGRARGDFDGVEFDVVRAEEIPAGGFDLWVPLGALETFWRRLGERAKAAGGGVIGQTAYDALRIEAGIPLREKDYTDENFPNEVRWDSALTYDKCYVGQEVVARIRTYGQVNRRLKGVRLAGRDVPAPGAAVTAGGEPIGAVTSSAFSERLAQPIALATIQRKHWGLDAAQVLAGGAAADAEVVELPFVAATQSQTGDDPV